MAATTNWPRSCRGWDLRLSQDSASSREASNLRALLAHVGTTSPNVCAILSPGYGASRSKGCHDSPATLRQRFHTIGHLEEMPKGSKGCLLLHCFCKCPRKLIILLTRPPAPVLIPQIFTDIHKSFEFHKPLNHTPLVLAQIRGEEGMPISVQSRQVIPQLRHLKCDKWQRNCWRKLQGRDAQGISSGKWRERS